MKGELKFESGARAAQYEIYDTRGSKVGLHLTDVMRSLAVLWLIEDIQAHAPSPRPFIVTVEDGSPWVSVRAGRAEAAHEYAIWRASGDIYQVTDGEVGDDPIISM